MTSVEGHTMNDKVNVQRLQMQPDTPMSPSARNAGSGKAPKVFFGVSDEQGPRPYMEDRHTLIRDFKLDNGDPTPRSFVAVYDGHSSSRGSEHASRRLHEIIAAQPAVRQCRGQGKVEEVTAMENALKAAFEIADDEIIQEADRKGKRYGTTAVAAVLVGSILWVAHCGDSQAVLYRDGAAVTLTREHKPLSDPSEHARITAQGGQVDNSDYVISNDGTRRLNMSRALGDAGHKDPKPLVIPEPDVSRIPLTPGKDQMLIMGTDGLFDVLGAGQIVRIAKRALEISRGRGDDAATAAADALVAEALNNGTHDNVTALVVLFDWE